MERIRVMWTYTTDIVAVPDEIFANIEEYTNDFFQWVSGVSFDDKVKDGTCFGTEQYVYYLNHHYLSESHRKAYVEYENYVPVTEKDTKWLDRMKAVYF